MRPYRYFKTLAKLSLAGKYFKCIIAFLFVSLLPSLILLIPQKFTSLTINQFLWILIPAYFILIPCFRMGAIGITFDAIEKKEISLGNLFDGFKYFFKLIPMMIAKFLSLAPLALTVYIFYKRNEYTLVKLFADYINNPSENIDKLLNISDKDASILLTFEFFFIASVIFAILVSCYLLFTEYIIFNEKVSGLKAIGKSIKLMKGHILYYIGFELSFILWHLASSFTYGLSTLILNPYKEATFIIFYNYLRFSNGEDISTKPEEVIKEEQI